MSATDACMHLQIKLGEEQLVRGKEIVSSFLRDPNVEGVYELQMPLVFRAILSLGCQAQVHFLPACNWCHISRHAAAHLRTAILAVFAAGNCRSTKENEARQADWGD
jgi:hypothetical protein